MSSGTLVWFWYQKKDKPIINWKWDVIGFSFFPFCYKHQEKTQIQKDLWRIEDVTAGLSANKTNYKTIVDSIKNPGKENVMKTLKNTQMQLNLWVCANNLELCSVAENPVHSALGCIRNLCWLSTLTWLRCLKGFFVFVFAYWWHLNGTSHKNQNRNSNNNNSNNGLSSSSCRGVLSRARLARTSRAPILHSGQELLSVFSAWFFLVFPLDAAQLPLPHLLSPSFRYFVSRASTSAMERRRESVCGLHCNCFIVFQRKDLTHWDSKRLWTPTVNSLSI